MSSSRAERKTENNQTENQSKKPKHTNKTKTNKTHKEPQAARWKLTRPARLGDASSGSIEWCQSTSSSLLECFRHVIRYARVAYSGWSRGSWLEGALVSAQSFIGSVTCLAVWRWISLLNFWFNVSRHTANPLWCISHDLSSTELAPFTMPVCFLWVFFVVWFVCFF